MEVIIMKVTKKLPDAMWLLIVDALTDGQVCSLSLGVVDKRRQLLISDFRVSRRLTLRNLDLRNHADILSMRRLSSSLQRRSHVQELEIESPLHFSAKDCLRLLSSCTFSSVWLHSHQASVKTDADTMREMLSQITETRNQLRGKAIALAQEVVDVLKPDISIDYILDLDVSADLGVTSNGSNLVELGKLQSLNEHVTKTKKLMTEHKKQLASLSLTAPLFCEAYRCCVNQRYNDSDINDCGVNMETKTKSQEVGLQLSRGPARATNLLADPDTTLRDEEARMLNIRPITGVAATHDHLEEIFNLCTSRLRYAEVLGRVLTSVLEQYRHNVLNSYFLSDQITPNELTPWVNRWSTMIRELERLNQELSKAITRKTTPDCHEDMHRLRSRVGLLVERNLMDTIAPPKQWTMFTKAMDIARDVYSSLKKAQQLCKLNPKAFESLHYIPVENASASASPKLPRRRLTIGMLIRSKLIKNYKSACPDGCLHKGKK